jgi:hypothetical protein
MASTIYAKQNILVRFAEENGHTFFTFKSLSEFRVMNNREGITYGEMIITEDPIKLLWDDEVPAL